MLWRDPALGIRLPRFRPGSCRLKSFADVVAALAGGSEFGGMDERFAQVGGGVGDLGASMLDAGERLGFAGFQAGEAVLQPVPVRMARRQPRVMSVISDAKCPVLRANR